MSATTATTHTPGPWEVDGNKALGAYGVWTSYATHPGHNGAGYPSQVCSVYSGNKSDFDRQTRDANARLIAAAPDLLAACQLVLRRWTFDSHQQHTHSWHDMQDCAEIIRAAIAKATPAPAEAGEESASSKK
jgi:hypothetical protein